MAQEDLEQIVLANKQLLSDLAKLQRELFERKMAIGAFRASIGLAHFIYHSLGISLATEINATMLEANEDNYYLKKSNAKIRRNDVVGLFNTLLKMDNRQDRRKLLEVWPDLIEAKSIIRKRIRDIEKREDLQ